VVTAPPARLRTREVVPRSVAPNLRDHGKTCDRDLLRILGHLQAQHGEAWASEAGLRRMFWQDTGHCPGVDTIRTALERLERQGVLEQIWLKPGGILPTGSVCTHGTRLVHLPQGRRARRALVTRSRNRRDGVNNRIDRRVVADVQAARASITRPVEPVDARVLEVERKRRDDLRRLAELAAAWEQEPKGKGPPE